MNPEKFNPGENVDSSFSARLEEREKDKKEFSGYQNYLKSCDHSLTLQMLAPMDKERLEDLSNLKASIQGLLSEVEGLAEGRGTLEQRTGFTRKYQNLLPQLHAMFGTLLDPEAKP